MCLNTRFSASRLVGLAVLCPLLCAAGTAEAGITLYVDDDAPPGGDGLSWSTAYCYLQDALDLLPYLPDRQAPENPFTGQPSEFKGMVGDLTYRSPRNGADYIIEAWGRDENGQPDRLLVLSGSSDRHEGR